MAILPDKNVVVRRCGINYRTLSKQLFHDLASQASCCTSDAAKEAEIVVVRTQVIKLGKSIINIKADVFNNTRRLVAQASFLIINNLFLCIALTKLIQIKMEF